MFSVILERKGRLETRLYIFNFFCAQDLFLMFFNNGLTTAYLNTGGGGGGGGGCL